MHGYGHGTLRRFRVSTLVATIALCLMAALAFGTRASADPPYPPPPSATSLNVDPPPQTNTHHGAHPAHEIHKPATDTSSGLADTGVATAAAVGIVALLVVGGGLLLYAGKRRPG
jgi:hypothetical protein